MLTMATWTFRRLCNHQDPCSRRAYSIGRGTTMWQIAPYDIDALPALAQAKGAWANIRATRNRKATFSFSPWAYRQRNLVERFFNKLKQLGAIATRYGKRSAMDS